MSQLLRIPFDTIKQELVRVLLKKGFSPERADRCAQLVTETSRDGVYSHGLNRFPRYMTMVDNGSVDVNATPQCVGAFGAVEQWDGCGGPGNLNAEMAMDRAIELAKSNGIGAVAMRNNGHWMRGGTYGWQAAAAGMVGLCWTNTNQNLPPWGSPEARIGNNPLVIAVPRKDGPIVLDMAMSQYSYGALATHRKAGKKLAVPGGFNQDGEVTQDPAEIEATWRPLPIGFWKGSALSITLDVLAAVLSGGNATHTISSDPLKEVGLSQCFIALSLVGDPVRATEVADSVVAHLNASPVLEGERVVYPGQRTLEKRIENMEKGIPVDADIWQTICSM